MAAKPAVNRTRQLLAIAATAALVGIAMSSVGATGGPLVTVAALVTLIVALHRFGRTGPDAAPRARNRRRPKPG